MKTKDGQERAALKEKAEALLRVKDVHSDALGISEAADLIHELEVHKAELEIQNEELRRSEEALSISRDRFSLFFNKAPAGYAVVDANGFILEVNETFCRMISCSAGELVGRSFFSLIAEGEQGAFISRFKAFFKNPEGKLFEYTLKTGENKTIFARLRGAALTPPLVWARHEGPQLIIGIQDITEKLQIEKKEKESSRLLHQIIDFLPDATFVIDRQGKVIAWNRAIEKMTGISAQQMIGKGDYEYSLAFYKERRPVLIDLVNDPDNKTLREYEYVIREGDRLISETSPEKLILGGVHLLNIACPLYDTEGNIVGAIESIRDITKQKKAEEALRESEERFRTAFYASPDAVNLNRLEDGMYVDINDGFTRLTGYTRADVIGKTSIDLGIWNDPEDRKRLVSELKERGFCENLEAEFRKKDGTLGIGLMSARLIQLNGAPHVVSITREITAMKEAEEEKKRLEAQLQQAQKMESVGRLAGGIAHDFNNMLSIILGRAELAAASLGEAHPIHKDLLDIQKAARRSADLTRQLLAFARKQIAAPRILDLNETIAGMLKMLRRLIGEDIELAWMPSHDLWPVRIDPAQVDQILANLCINARDAISYAGKITIGTQNVVLDETYSRDYPELQPGRYVMLEVSDTGCGMSNEVMQKLFEPFFTTKEVGKGTGLGLATVYGIVKQNYGHINVYSELGLGTTFKIYLPASGEKTASEDDDQRQIEIPRGTETILLVEDEPLLLEMGTIMLSRLGYRVLGATGPLKALEIASEYEGAIDLLMTDVVMPEMNGKELAARIAARRNETRCLFTSGYTADVIARHGVLEQGVNFIQKPYSFRDLADSVKGALKGRTQM